MVGTLVTSEVLDVGVREDEWDNVDDVIGHSHLCDACRSSH